MADELSIMGSFGVGYVILSIAVFFIGIAFSATMIAITGLVIFGLSSMVLIYKSVIMRYSYPNKIPPRTAKPPLMQQSKEPKLRPIRFHQLSGKEHPQLNSQTIYVEPLSKEVLSCCYNTAIIGNGYCLCGRAIPVPLSQLFHSQT